jgi:energy-coupling factor transport system permease protein
LAEIRTSFYLGHDSLLGRVDARTKLLWILWTFAMITVVLDPRYQTVIIASIVAAVIAGRINPVILVKTGRLGVYVGIASLLLWVFFIPDRGDVLFRILGRPVTDVGVEMGVSVAVRVIVVLFAFLIVAMTTPTRNIITALHRLRVPTVFAMVVGMVLRMIPQLQAEHSVIMEAQRSRGIDFDQGWIFTRLKRHMSYIVPLAIRSLKIVNEMSIAMDSRAFDPYGKRTFQPEMHFRGIDHALLALMAATLAGGIVLRLCGYAGWPQ